MNKAVANYLEDENYSVEDLLNEYQTSGEITQKTDNARITKQDGTGPHGKGNGPGQGKADGSGKKEKEEEEEDDLLQPGGLVGLGNKGGDK